MIKCNTDFEKSHVHGFCIFIRLSCVNSKRRYKTVSFLLAGLSATTYKVLIMYIIGGVLIFLAVNRKMEPALLLPLGFGAILGQYSFLGSNAYDPDRHRRGERYSPVALRGGNRSQ